jgi:hypothetical protein
MGPWSIDQGKSAVADHDEILDVASMGPWSIDQGKFSNHPNFGLGSISFNGALVYRPGKVSLRGRTCGSTWSASMGPWSIDQGKFRTEAIVGPMTSCFNGALVYRPGKGPVPNLPATCAFTRPFARAYPEQQLRLGISGTKLLSVTRAVKQHRALTQDRRLHRRSHRSQPIQIKSRSFGLAGRIRDRVPRFPFATDGQLGQGR